jgi:hypothetical protein
VRAPSRASRRPAASSSKRTINSRLGSAAIATPTGPAVTASRTVTRKPIPKRGRTASAETAG